MGFVQSYSQCSPWLSERESFLCKRYPSYTSAHTYRICKNRCIIIRVSDSGPDELESLTKLGRKSCFMKPRLFIYNIDCYSRRSSVGFYLSNHSVNMK